MRAQAGSSTDTPRARARGCQTIKQCPSESGAPGGASACSASSALPGHEEPEAKRTRRERGADDDVDLSELVEYYFDDARSAATTRVHIMRGEEDAGDPGNDQAVDRDW